jgi:solute carrier family 35, member C2
MERTHYAVDSEEHALNEPFTDDLRGSHEDEEITRAAGIHLASIAEKKRLWLKNAALNALFIAIWSVNNPQ